MWRIPKIWEGADVWIFGGGPSIPVQFEIPQEVIDSVLSKKKEPSVYSPYLKALHDKHVIAVNSAYLIGDWMDMCFFGDKKWYFNNRERLRKFPGLKITCHGHFNTKEYRAENVKFVEKDRSIAWGLSDRPGYVSWNGNSGAAAINMAINAGAKRVILLGFDMRLGADYKQHWHALYKSANRSKAHAVQQKRLPFERHLRAFPPIRRLSKQWGIKIINCSPDSAIEQFEKLTVKEVLDAL